MKKDIANILSDLIYKDMLGALQPSEREELDGLCNRYKISQAEREEIIGRLEGEGRFDAREAYRRFMHRTRRCTMLRYLRVAAVVALLLGGGGVSWWLYQAEQPEVPVVAKAEQPIAPGSSKAVITLSTGEQVELENLTRHLQETNGTRIEVAGGSLTYRDSLQSEALIYNEISIPRGGEFHLVLADGTQVWLNAETSLKYPVAFSGDCREVFLKGEAYFEVAHDARMPFYVHTSRGKVQVLGTSFNVRDYGDEHKVVTVLESGKVRYTSTCQESKDLLPGYLLEDVEGQGLLSRKVDTRLYTSWREGKYLFENASVEEIMTTLQRWYNIRVIYLDESVKHLHFTGDLERYDTFDTFLRFMEAGGDLVFQTEGNTVIVNKK